MGSVNTACVNASHSSGKAIYVCGRHHVPSTFAQCSLTLFYLCRARQLSGSSKLALCGSLKLKWLFNSALLCDNAFVVFHFSVFVSWHVGLE